MKYKDLARTFEIIAAKKSSYTYDYFEEALSEGIKEAVKILKESL